MFFAVFVLIIESLPLAVARVVAVVVVIVAHLGVVVFQVVIGEDVVVVIFGILQGDGGFDCVVDHYEILIEKDIFLENIPTFAANF